MILRVLLAAAALSHGALSAEEPATDAIAAIEKAFENHDWKKVAEISAAEAAKNPGDKSWALLVSMAGLKMQMERVRPERRVRLRQTASQLPREGQELLQDFGGLFANWFALPDPDSRSSEGAALLSSVKQFAQLYPDLPRAWVMQAELALALNRSIEGRIAARNLEALKVWESSSQDVLSLLGALQLRGWFPGEALAASQKEALDQFTARYGALPQDAGRAAALADLLHDIKKFNLDNTRIPGGWLAQFDLALQAGRRLDASVAQNRLTELRTPKPSVAGPKPEPKPAE